jgi:hypothetical protein
MLADEFAQMYRQRPSASPLAPDLKASPPQQNEKSPGVQLGDRAQAKETSTSAEKTAGAEQKQRNPNKQPTGTEQTEPTCPEKLKQLYLDFHAGPAYPRSALCLSGGGIRSGAFALGVIQFLASAGLLHRFEYLSTVSGGGYIGSWLSAWFTRVVDAKGEGGYAEIGPKLARRDMPEIEPAEIDGLRANSNYLTPKLGAFSADTWTALAIWLRNLLINWFLLIPLICAAAVVPQILSAFTGYLEHGALALLVQIVGICCYAVSLIWFNGARPRWQAFNLDQPKYLRRSLSFLIASAVLWAVSMANTSNLPFVTHASVGPFVDPIPDYVVLATILYIIAMLFAHAWNYFWPVPHVRISKCVPVEGSLVYYFDRTEATNSAASVEVYTEDHQAAAGKHYEPASANIVFAPDKIDGGSTLIVKLRQEKIAGIPVKDGDFFVKFRSPIGVRIGASSAPERWKDTAAFIFSGLCFGLCLGAGDHVFRAWFPPEHSDYITVWHHLLLSTLAVPWLLLSHALATVVFIALTSWLPRSDEEREWIGRAVGWVLVTALLWTVIAALVLLVPYAIEQLLEYLDGEGQTVDVKTLATAIAAVASAIAAVSGLLTAIVGGGPKTAAIPGQPQTLWRKLALYVGAPVFLASLFVGLALVVDLLALGDVFTHAVGRVDPRDPNHSLIAGASGDLGSIGLKLFIWAVALGILSVLVGRFININRFSLHEIYRNRLVRAFLGASNIRRKTNGGREYIPQRDEFTFFNYTDNIPVSRLWIRQNEKPPAKGTVKKPASKRDWRPFHILNIALNLVDTDKPAWQERKAESFTVSPLWCGSAQLDAFRRTSEYGGQNDPISLGTAMAISGAAVSPNMGYNSSPLITFLLTLFNVRLGWWLGHPKYNRFADEGPRWAAAPLLFELFGLTNDNRNYVYLSDGGHFENLGLYEMIRRRCHLIIVSDAGQDKDLAFADLANAVRKIYIDLGVRIVFPKLEELRVRNKDRNDPKAGGPCYTVGRILYGESDGERANEASKIAGKEPSETNEGSKPKIPDGYILYLKPGFRGDEAADIVGYAAESTEFPHESTVDQWFSESQFESYRKLGFSIMERAHNAAVENYNKRNPGKEIKSFDDLSQKLPPDVPDGVMLSFFASLSEVETSKKTALPGATIESPDPAQDGRPT